MLPVVSVDSVLPVVSAVSVLPEDLIPSSLRRLPSILPSLLRPASVAWLAGCPAVSALTQNTTHWVIRGFRASTWYWNWE